MLFEAGAVGGPTGRKLLGRFRARDGAAAELAFAALVARHGPMILRVCREALRDEHAAQDAFQTTLPVLVRKAGSLMG
jgi:DNA-directed RNA polymerase specialized sigma24 family protein